MCSFNCAVIADLELLNAGRYSSCVKGETRLVPAFRLMVSASFFVGQVMQDNARTPGSGQ